MREKIEALMAEVAGLSCKTEQEIEQARVRLLGKKGEITALFDEFRTVAPELKREFGQKLNVLKNAAAAKIEELKEAAAESPAAGAASFDYTMPGDPVQLGSRHPVSIAREEIVNIFRKFGYDVAEGPEVEDDWHVFEALNFPPEHPAREMQDTFFIKDSDNPVLLRTHTSSVQVRAMEKMPLPIRIVCPGRVFRNEAISARAHCIFHQVEGLYIDENVTFADMKQPMISSQPVPLQMLHPFPPQMLQLTSISAEGSVNGKYEGRIRIWLCAPNISRAKSRIACFMSAKVTFSSIYSPST